jgi:hypothetical protein
MCLSFMPISIYDCSFNYIFITRICTIHYSWSCYKEKSAHLGNCENSSPRKEYNLVDTVIQIENLLWKMKKVLEEVQNQQQDVFLWNQEVYVILYVTNTVAFILFQIFFCSENSPSPIITNVIDTSMKSAISAEQFSQELATSMLINFM